MNFLTFVEMKDKKKIYLSYGSNYMLSSPSVAAG